MLLHQISIIVLSLTKKKNELLVRKFTAFKYYARRQKIFLVMEVVLV